MSVITTSTTKRGRLVADFNLQGVLSVQRNLGILTASLPGMHKTAIRTARRRIPVEARRDIQAEYDIQAGRVRQDLTARETSEGIRLVGHFRGIGLRNYRARQTAKGVTYAIFRGNRELEAGAFIAPMANRNEHVVQRVGAKRVMTQGRYKGKRRQPLQVQYGPTVAQMLRKGRRSERLADFARGVLGDEMTRLLNYYLGGRPLSSIPGASA